MSYNSPQGNPSSEMQVQLNPPLHSTTKNKPTIGILYIATGRYTIFWEEFYRSAERYFIPECEKHYFVFTDHPEHIKHQGNVSFYHQEKLGWPYDTLMRFDIFLKAEEKLHKMDYLYFFNSNIEFIDTITLDAFTSQEQALLGILHPGFWDKGPQDFTYDRTPQCRAYIPQGAGYKYFMGGGNGGEAKRFIRLIKELSQRIQADLNEGIIALWHDESHLNRYYYEHHTEVKVLPVAYATPQEWAGSKALDTLRYVQILKKRGVKIVIRNKANPWYGGHAWLRGQTDQKVLGLRAKVLVALYRIYKALF